jgi:hypothetical protein
LTPTAERIAACAAQIVSGTRPSGAFRGSSTDRTSRAWPISTFAAEWHVGSVHRGKILSDVTVMPGEISTWPEGGRDDHADILPACMPCKALRNDGPISTVELGA